jgi:signal transduction histidine kinase
MEFIRLSNTEIILGVSALIVYFYLGFSVYLRDPKSWTNKIFAFFVLVLAIYTIVNPISLHPIKPTPESQLFWIRIVIFVASFIGPTLFLLIHTFPGRKITLQRRYIWAILGITLANALASLTPLIFSSISYPGGSPVPAPGNGIFIFFLNFPVMVILAFGLLIKKYIHAAGEERTKILYFLAGIVTTFSLMIVLTVILVVIFKTPAGIFLAPISPVILAGFMAYAIIRHGFLDIQPIIARAVSFLFILFILAASYTALILFVVRRFFLGDIEVGLLVLFFVMLFVGMLVFQSIERITRRVTNRLFFKEMYDPDKLFSSLTRIMAETIDLAELSKQVLDVLRDQMKVSKGAFLIISEHRISDVYEVGFHDHQLRVPALENLFHENSRAAKEFLFEELPEGPAKDLFRRLDILVAIPIRVEDREVAILVLGPKSSGERYHPRDIAFLNTFAAEAGIAIQNAEAYIEIKRFSEELEKRVIERTKALEESQKKELAKAQEVSRLKDEFVFIATHELRTPITAIRGFLELISEGEKSFPKDIRKLLKNMSSASNNLNQLVNDLLEIARSEGGTLKIISELTNVVPIVESVIKEVKPIAIEKGVTIHLDIRGMIPSVMADSARVKEVITNFISNAIKYNREKGKVFIQIFKASDGPGELIVEFRDTGYGIPKDQQDKIFQKFFRVQSLETQRVLGTGLGLFITRMMVEKMGGKVVFSSVEGEGSTFAFSLPLGKK